MFRVMCGSCCGSNIVYLSLSDIPSFLLHAEKYNSAPIYSALDHSIFTNNNSDVYIERFYWTPNYSRLGMFLGANIASPLHKRRTKNVSAVTVSSSPPAPAPALPSITLSTVLLFPIRHNLRCLSSIRIRCRFVRLLSFLLCLILSHSLSMLCYFLRDL